MLLAINVMANVIYEKNDIPLLDNRFRIDPNTAQITIILNHPKKSQKVVLVKPDGGKWYAERHPNKDVAWLETRDQDIITIINPTPGPWQAIAKLHGDNRIQLLNPVSLHVGKIPIRIYRNEYITTDASLIKDGEVMTDKTFLKNISDLGFLHFSKERPSKWTFHSQLERALQGPRYAFIWVLHDFTVQKTHRARAG